MKKISYILGFFASFFLLGNAIIAQSIEIQMDTVKNCANKTYCVTLKVKKAASSADFKLGTSSIFVKYNKDALHFDQYTSAAFDGSGLCAGGASSAWDMHRWDGVSPYGELHISLSLLDDNFSCPSIGTTLRTIGTLCFDITEQGGSPDLEIDVTNTHFNVDLPNNGTVPVTVAAIDSVFGAGLLLCDCAGAGMPCDDNNVYTIEDKFDNNCKCRGEYIDVDGDNIWDGVDACIEEHLEAEEANTYGTLFDNREMLFTGDGYMDFQDSTGEFLEWVFQTDVAGDYDFGFRYALPWGNRPMIVSLDGVVIDTSMNFPDTGDDWSDWDTITITRTLAAGNHRLHITPSPNGNSSGANYDHLLLSFCTTCSQTGTPCDDGDSCTTDDVYDTNCNCGGRYDDSDDDGVCDAQDQCPGGDDTADMDGDGIPDFCDDCDNALIGQSCDDGNPCTINDTIDVNCNCAGTFQGPDSDGDGVCDAYDQCPGGDDNEDMDGDGIPDFCDTCDDRLVGKPCDDGDPCTVLDAIQPNCNCWGFPIPLEIDETLADLTCYGYDDGSIELSISGTMGTVYFDWNTGDSTANLYNLAPGSYDVLATDTRGCTASKAFIIQEPPPFEIIADLTMDSGANDGAINVTTIGGIAPYTFVWKDSVTTEDRTGLTSATYTVTATDTWGCPKILENNIFPAAMCLDTFYDGEDAQIHSNSRVKYDDTCTAIGYGYADFRGDTFEFVEFTIDIPEGGLYDLSFRYSHGWGNRRYEVSIDDEVVETNWILPKTYDWNVYDFKSLSYAFYPGQHRVKIRQQEQWGANIDLLAVCLSRAGVKIAPKIALMKPDANGLMRDDLRENGLLPLTEPYTSMGYNFTGVSGGETADSSVFQATGNDAIVDWVVVELHRGAPNYEVVESRAALLQRDGDVVEIDGVSTLQFPSLRDSSFLVSVHHRNYLGAMTAAAIPLNNATPTALDFTNNTTAMYGTNALRNYGNGIYGLWSGDANADGEVRFKGNGSDAAVIQQFILNHPFNIDNEAAFIITGYSPLDVNMDGKIIYQGENSDLLDISSPVFSHPDNTTHDPHHFISEQKP